MPNALPSCLMSVEWTGLFDGRTDDWKWFTGLFIYPTVGLRLGRGELDEKRAVQPSRKDEMALTPLARSISHTVLGGLGFPVEPRNTLTSKI